MAVAPPAPIAPELQFLIFNPSKWHKFEHQLKFHVAFDEIIPTLYEEYKFKCVPDFGTRLDELL